MWCDVNGQGADAEMTGRVGGGGKPAAPPAESGCGPIRAQIAAKPRSAQPIRSQHTRKTIDIIVTWTVCGSYLQQALRTCSCVLRIFSYS